MLLKGDSDDALCVCVVFCLIVPRKQKRTNSGCRTFGAGALSVVSPGSVFEGDVVLDVAVSTTAVVVSGNFSHFILAKSANSGCHTLGAGELSVVVLGSFF